MSNFNQICKEFEKLDVSNYGDIIAEKSLKILPALKKISNDGLTGASVYATFILGAVVADGKVSEEEYLLCYPLFRVFFGEEINYEYVKNTAKLLKPQSRELKKCVDGMVDLLGQISEDLKNDVIVVCMIICAVDGKISLKEKNWIKQLIK